MSTKYCYYSGRCVCNLNFPSLLIALMRVYVDDGGGIYGHHKWEQDDVVSQTGGDFLCIHVSTRSVFSVLVSLNSHPPY